MSAKAATIRLVARDVSGQKESSIDGPVDGSIGELIRSCLDSDTLRLPRNDFENNPLTYRAFRQGGAEGLGEGLNAYDRVGDVLREDDTVVLAPRVTAG